MLVGAVMGFWRVQRIGGPRGMVLLFAVVVAALAGAAVALLFAFLVVTLRANQIVSGLALTIFAGAAGLSSYLGNDFELADDAGAVLVRARRRVRSLRTSRSSGRSSSGRRGSCTLSWVLRHRHRALPDSRTRPGPQRSRGRRVAHDGGRDGDQRHGVPLCSTRRRRGFRGDRRRLLQPRADAARGWTVSRAVRAGSRSRSSSSPSGGRALPRRRVLLRGVPALPLILQARGVTIAPSSSRRFPYVMTIVVLVIVSSGIAKRRLGAPGSARSTVRARGTLMDVHTPHTLDEALRLKAELPDARFVQGGTDVLVELNFDRSRPPALINLNEVAELRGFSRENGTLRPRQRSHLRRGDARCRRGGAARPGGGVAHGGLAPDPQPRHDRRQPRHRVPGGRRAAAAARRGCRGARSRACAESGASRCGTSCSA